MFLLIRSSADGKVRETAELGVGVILGTDFVLTTSLVMGGRKGN